MTQSRQAELTLCALACLTKLIPDRAWISPKSISRKQLPSTRKLDQRAALHMRSHAGDARKRRPSMQCFVRIRATARRPSCRCSHNARPPHDIISTYFLSPLELYKISTGKYDSDCGLSLYLRSDIVYASITRGNKFKLVPQHCKLAYDLRKHYFTNRVVPIWNSLPNDVVMADNINLFKNHLDKLWPSCEFVYSYRAQPSGTGSVK